jgi:transposase
VRIVSCYEAGYDGHWLHRWLTNQGVINYVIDPASIQVNRRARRPKTDRIDLEQLMSTLLRYLRGEPRVCSMVRVPSPQDEDRRRVSRERDRLLKERCGHTPTASPACCMRKEFATPSRWRAGSSPASMACVRLMGVRCQRG